MKYLVMVVFAVVGGLTGLYGMSARAEDADAHHEHFAECAKFREFSTLRLTVPVF